MMSDISSFTGKFRANKTALHESSAARVTKRPRDSLVCNQCRRSKLRCDRGKPCGSCVKRDDAEVCSYQRPIFPSLVDPGHYSLAEDRLLHLESIIKHLMQGQTSVQFSNDNALDMSGTSSEGAETSHKGTPIDADYERSDRQADNPNYVGYTHWSAILDDIHDLKMVLGNSEDVHGGGEPTQPDRVVFGNEIIYGSSRGYSIKQIISQYLPPEIEVNRYLSTYFRGEIFIIPFVHTYHFQSQYREFWTDPMSVNPLWLSILFSICYMASLVGEGYKSHHPSQEDVVTEGSTLHTAAAQCLVLGDYHRPQQYAVEALSMYGHCKNFTTLDPCRESGEILGMVVRMAYEMGYHRDPDSFGSFTPFEGEMRRRFWAVCRQMDMMVSFQLGLPSNIRLDYCDTKSPRNLLDSDFNADTQKLPASRSENEATGLLWFVIKDRQMASFSKVCEDALSFKESSEAEILKLDQEIRIMHQEIPDVLRVRSLAQSIMDPPVLIMTRFYLEFISLKSFCVLHRRYMARGNTFSTITCVEAGKSLVGQFIDMYKEFSPGGQLQTESWMLTNFTMNDFLLGVMVLCLVLHTRWKRNPPNSIIDTATEVEVCSLLRQSHKICVENSKASRDARRVSHAISLTLGLQRSDPSENIASESSQASSVPVLGSRQAYSENGVEDPAFISLRSQRGDGHGEEAAFGLLDPFNFLGNDIDNIDWSLFDSQTLGLDESMGSFTVA